MEDYNENLIPVFHWLLNKQGRNVSTITELEQAFPHNKNIQQEIEQCKGFFWTGYANSGLEIRPKLPIRLCTQYQTSNGFCSGDCNKIHLCPLNLLGPKLCKGPCKNNLSHNINDRHNIDIIQCALPIGASNCGKSTPVLLRTSLLRLCKTFQDTGQCEKIYCGYLHICLDYLKGTCAGKCQLAQKSNLKKEIVHDFCRSHNRKVLSNFGYDAKMLSNKEELLHNLLLPKDDKDDDNQSVSSSISDISTLSELNYNTNFSEDQKTTRIHKWITQNTGVHVKAEIKCLTKRFTNFENLLETLQADKKMFWVRQLPDDNHEIHVKVPVDLCDNYNKSLDCQDEGCQRLHLCKKFLWSEKSCPDADACQYEHCINTHHNYDILEKVFPNGYDDTMKMKVLRSSFPRVCNSFLKDGCCTKPLCGYFHICPDFLRGTCKKTCSVAEKTGLPKTVTHFLRDDHNKQVFAMFFSDDMVVKRDIVEPNIILNPDDELNGVSCSIPDLSSLSLHTFDENMFESEEVAIIHRLMSQDGSEVSEQLENQFKHNNENEILLKLKDNKKMFWVAQVTDKKFRMCPKVYVNLCQDYNDALTCDGACDKLHLCKKLLLSDTSCMDTEQCQYDHDLNSHHNIPILVKAFPKGYNDQMKMKVLRRSFPKVCNSFLQEGSCDQSFCGHYHMCQKSIIGNCRKDCLVAEKSGETKSVTHSFTLLSHNMEVSKTFFPFDEDVKRKMVKPNLLVEGINLVTAKNVDNNVSGSTSNLSPSLKSNEDTLFGDQKTTRIHQWITQNTGVHVKAEIKCLTKRFTNFENLLETLQADKKMFWVRQLPDDNHEIHVKVPVDLCDNYNKSQDCQDEVCQKLHLCKKFLWSEKSCPDADACQYEHCINTFHNYDILEKVFPNGYDDTMKMKVLRSSFPRVCNSFLKDGCCTKPLCGYFHICPDFLRGTCKKTCSVAEKTGLPKTVTHFLRDDHNKEVFAMFFSDDMEVKRDVVEPNIILNPDDELNCVSCSIPDLSSLSLHTFDENMFESAEMANVHKWMAAQTNSPSCGIKKLAKQFKSIDNILERLQDNKEKFWISEIVYDSYEIRPKISVYLCKDYTANKFCCNNLCQKLHLCNRLLWSPVSCPNVGNTCEYNHDLKIDHNKAVLAKVMPKGYTDDMKMKVLRSSFPRICGLFLVDGSCTKPFCGYFHICQQFIEGTCPRICNLAEKSGKTKTTVHNFTREHNKRVFRMFFEDDLNICRDTIAHSIIIKPEDRLPLLPTPVPPPLMSLETNFTKIPGTVLPRNNAYSVSTRPGKLSSSQAFTSSVQFVNMEAKPKTMATSVPNLATSLPVAVGTTSNQLNVEFCKHYLNGNCPRKKCPFLHLCKELLLDQKSCPGDACEYGFSHNPLDLHNEPIIRKANSILPNDEVLKKLKKSFPRVCFHYQTKNCLKKCKRLHVCLNFLQNSVCTSNGCDLSHDVFDDYNKAVLDSHGSKFQRMLESVDEVVANILFVKQEKEKEPTLLKSLYDQILNSPNGCLNLDSEIENFDTAAVQDFIKTGEFKNHFRICRRENQNVIYVCPKNVALCKLYLFNSKKPCRKHDCVGFHLCKKFIVNKNGCHSEGCCGNHDFDDQHEQKLIKQHHLEDLSEEQLKVLFIYRYPIVCAGYQQRKCRSANDCSDVHVCSPFLFGYCKDSTKCSRLHEEGLQSEQAKRITKEYHITDNELRSCLTMSRKRRCLDKIVVKEDLALGNENSSTVDSSKNTDCTINEENVCSIEPLPPFVGPPPTDCGFRQFPIKLLPPFVADYGFPQSQSPIKPLPPFFAPPPVNTYYGFPQSQPPTKPLPNTFVAPPPSNTDCGLPQTQSPIKQLPAAPSKLNSFKSSGVVKLTDFSSSGDNPVTPVKENVQARKTDTSMAVKLARTNSTNPAENVKGFDQGTPKLESRISANLPNEPTHTDQQDQKPSTKTFVGFESSTKLTSEWEPPSEMDVFKFIIQCPNAHVKFSAKRTLCSQLFQSKSLLCLKWFKDHPDTFRLTCNKKEVFLCVKDIKPCLDYWSKTGCIGDCNLFHICKESLFDIAHSAISCGKHHDFSDTHNQRIIGNFSLEPLNTRQLKCLLKNTLPSVCKEYLENKCNDLQCEDVHICGDFVNGECLKHSALCSFHHEVALSDNHADEIMKLFHISDNTSLLKKSLVYFKPKSEEKKKQEFLQHPAFKFLKHEAICVSYLNDVCDKDENCSLLHPKNCVPYRWQYKKPNENLWKMFPNNLNDEIEKAFCDPTKSKYDFADKSSYITFHESSKITSFYTSENVEIRRLSTASTASRLRNPKYNYYTAWKWYWKDNSGKWIEYSGKVTSDTLEYAFQCRNAYHFKTGEYNYKLDFDAMQQQNLGPKYFTKRNVIRRPVFLTTNNIQTAQDDDITPWHWPKEVSMEGGRLDIESSKKQQIVQEFKTSMERNLTVLDVEEICNAEFYQKYQSKKKILTKKLGGNDLNELELYHGTDATVVDGICVQNFDWRLNGKNATAFGQGSYFATSASYSLNYTRPDSNKIRYMFVAKVLAGRYAQGSSDIKRPPPISPLDPHTLYDSCVNNISTPSMYIVFERDQCYPQYLITFLQDDENLSSPSNRYDRYLQTVNQYDIRKQQQAIASIARKHKSKPLTQRPFKSIKRHASATSDSTTPDGWSSNIPSSSNSSNSYSTSSNRPTAQPSASKNKGDKCVIS